MQHILFWEAFFLRLQQLQDEVGRTSPSSEDRVLSEAIAQYAVRDSSPSMYLKMPVSCPRERPTHCGMPRGWGGSQATLFLEGNWGQGRVACWTLWGPLFQPDPKPLEAGPGWVAGGVPCS